MYNSRVSARAARDSFYTFPRRRRDAVRPESTVHPSIQTSPEDPVELIRTAFGSVGPNVLCALIVEYITQLYRSQDEAAAKGLKHIEDMVTGLRGRRCPPCPGALHTSTAASPQEKPKLVAEAAMVNPTPSPPSVEHQVVQQTLVTDILETSTNTTQRVEMKSTSRQYGRDFLLSLRFVSASMQKPVGLTPFAEEVLVKSQNRGLGQRPPRRVISHVFGAEVELKKAENAWRPTKRSEGANEDPEKRKTQELFRTMRSILNKLTPEKFTQLQKQVMDLPIDTEERILGIVDSVFEKAIVEPSFAAVYAKLCANLATLNVPVEGDANSTVNFRKLLLSRCQKEFEKLFIDDLLEKKKRELEGASGSERKHLQEELMEAKAKARKRFLNNVQFIGELFKLDLVRKENVHLCVVRMLTNQDEQSLEGLCRLLTTTGKQLDANSAKMDQYIEKITAIVKEKRVSSRIRFMLQDVIDLRLHNWMSQRAAQCPKTIQQIHIEAKREEQEEERKVHQKLLARDRWRGDDLYIKKMTAVVKVPL